MRLVRVRVATTLRTRGFAAVFVVVLVLLLVGCSGGGRTSDNDGSTLEPISVAAPTVSALSVAAPTLSFEVEATPERVGDVIVGDDHLVLRKWMQSEDGPNAFVTAVDRATGEVLWASEERVVHAPWSNVSLVRDGVYVEGYFDAVRAFDVTTGELRWTTGDYDFLSLRGDHLVARDGPYEYSPAVTFDPVSGEQLFELAVLPVTPTIGRALRPDGVTVGVDLATGETIWELAADIDDFAPAQFGSLPDITAWHARVGADYWILALDVRTGEVVWERDIDPQTVKRTPDMTRLVIETGDTIEVVDVATGLTQWQGEVSDSHHTMITNEAIVTADGEWHDYSTAGDFVEGDYFVSKLTGFDTATGAELWSVGLSDSTATLTRRGAGELESVIAVRTRDRGADSPTFSSVTLFDPRTGIELYEPINVRGRDTFESGGVHLRGPTGIVIWSGQVRALDGTVLATLATVGDGGPHKVQVFDWGVVVFGDHIRIFDW